MSEQPEVRTPPQVWIELMENGQVPETVASLQQRLDEEIAAHQKLRADVLRVAAHQKRQREWCTVVNQMLEDIGIPFPAATWAADVRVDFHVKAEIPPSEDEEHPGIYWAQQSVHSQMIEHNGMPGLFVWIDEDNRAVEITEVTKSVSNFRHIEAEQQEEAADDW